MQVVGTTTQQEVWVASRERKFIINEILFIEDPGRQFPRGEVVETNSFNRFIPLTTEHNALVDGRVLAGLQAVGFDIHGEEVNLARVRLIGEIATPVAVGAPVRLPVFDEVAGILVRQSPERGLTLGTIRGTGNLLPGLPANLKDVLCLYDGERGILPQDGVPFVFDYRTMNEYPHIGIFGGSGSGKSFGLRVLLEEFMAREVPGIVLDPHYEMDFSTPFPALPACFQRDYRDRFRIFTVGVDVGVEFTDLSIRELVALLGEGEPISEGMANAVNTLHERGDSLQSFSTRLYGLIEAMENERPLRRDEASDPHLAGRDRMLQDLLKRYGSKAGHVSSLKGVAWRLNALEREGVFTANTRPVEEALTARRLAVVRGPVRLLQVYGAYLFDRLYQKRRRYRDAMQKGQQAAYFPPFILATDEAHNFCPRGERDPASRRITRLIAQEGRKYGVNLVLASQRIALLDDTVTAQLNTKLIFRTVRAMDIATVKEETDLGTEETDRLPYLTSGHCFISSAVTGRAVAVRIRCAGTASPHTENPFDELERHSRAAGDKFWQVVREHLPFGAFELHIHGPAIARELGEPLSNQQLLDRLRILVREGKLAVEKGPLGERFTGRE
ncbi:hypothetical protein A6M21_04430 [Desulfotomaculum copahuensis]|uniref:Helicase HerA central domain-containing protein n=1 Tax=Desulfotomaculum copahuensis TaxID=1838280 RepID=A0A1B7LHH5_9FIRM|nr:hypothetical protein A6M21_04430 [Desulfotomaculum copahuensis]